LREAGRNRTSALMLRFFDFQVNLSTDQGRIKEIEVTARMTGITGQSLPDLRLCAVCALL
jgi:hypothetical protein